MRCTVGRMALGSFVLFAGIVGLGSTLADAADEAVPESEFKMLVEQDAGQIVKVLNDGKPAKKTADRAAKSSALMIAAYAQGRFGKNAADDGKLVALRDAAIQVAKDAGEKKYAPAAKIAKTLSPSMNGDDKAKAEKIDLIKATKTDVEELMYQFKKKAVGGLGVEEDIKAFATKTAPKPDAAIAIAYRVLVVGELGDNKELGPEGGFSAAKPRNQWESYNKDMRAAANDLITAAKSKDVKAMQTAFTKLDGSCVACHNKFK